jgi:hypothetical protein
MRFFIAETYSQLAVNRFWAAALCGANNKRNTTQANSITIILGCFDDAVRY